MNRYTFVLPSENQNALSAYNVADVLKIRFFCKDIHETLKYAAEFSRVKIMTKFKKNTHLSLSLLVELSMHFDFPERMSLSFFLYLHLQKRFG